ncbi:superoxide dismutase [Methanospirillum stamsii]|uniref:Superoxide dismutase n=1 Tax=Methanospirillum stamsii TaxID=1277351 RepID=A0A2V2NI37_9EURY|nr:superoxide dismutase [Methanospirillum stamsii]PWR76077.1 superoxide dismutase [Methanospirillum stamsii]
MDDSKKYALPALSFGYGDLTPYISEKQLTLHHQKHHQAYVNGANAIFEKLEKSRAEGSELDQKAVLKELSFHIGGHRLHTLFWENLAPAGKGGGGKPSGTLAEWITKDFGSLERFKKEFNQAASSVEGSGWAVLSICLLTQRLLVMQVEKHNINVYPGFKILMALDVWEHSYYLDYVNDRGKFVENFWYIVNWDAVQKRLTDALKN